jgi:hypothetical protein
LVQYRWDEILFLEKPIFCIVVVIAGGIDFGSVKDEFSLDTDAVFYSELYSKTIISTAQILDFMLFFVGNCCTGDHVHDVNVDGYKDGSACHKFVLIILMTVCFGLVWPC